MGLEEAARRIYGVPTTPDSVGSWYESRYGGKPWSVAEERVRSARAAAERGSPFIPGSERYERAQQSDPSFVKLPGTGVSPARRKPAGRKKKPELSDRGLNIKRDAAYWIERGQEMGYGGPMVSGAFGNPQAEMPAYTTTSSAPGAYLQAQAQHQAEQGLYTEGHVNNVGDWSPDKIRQLQRQLVQAGLLTDKFRLGIFDPATRDAYTGLLTLANDNGGKTKNEMLSQLIATAPSDDLKSFFRKPDFLEPDRDSLIQDIESVFEQRLGRNPTAAERKHLADYYARQARKEYRLETVPQEWNQYAQQAAGAITGAEETLAGGPKQAARRMGLEPRNARDVDPGASFASYFRNRYRNEEQEIKRREEQEELQVTAAQGFDQLRGMMAAGGVQQLGA